MQSSVVLLQDEVKVGLGKGLANVTGNLKVQVQVQRIFWEDQSGPVNTEPKLSTGVLSRTPI